MKYLQTNVDQYRHPGVASFTYTSRDINPPLRTLNTVLEFYCFTMQLLNTGYLYIWRV